MVTFVWPVEGSLNLDFDSCRILICPAPPALILCNPLHIAVHLLAQLRLHLQFGGAQNLGAL